MHPIFGVKREDDVYQVYGTLSLGFLATEFGRPYVGVSHTVSESSFPTKDFERTRFMFGITREF